MIQNKPAFLMLITVATFRNPIEAHIVRGRLECEGVAAYVCHEHHIWVDWTMSWALGEVKVQVSEGLAAEAVQIVSHIENGKYLDVDLDSELSETESHCKKCDSSDIVRVNWPWKLALVFLFIFSFPIPYTTKRVKCVNCGKAWTESEGKPYSLISIGIVLIGLFVGIWLFEISAEYLCKITTESNYCS